MEGMESGLVNKRKNLGAKPFSAGKNPAMHYILGGIKCL